MTEDSLYTHPLRINVYHQQAREQNLPSSHAPPQSNRGLHSDSEAYDFLSLSRSQHQDACFLGRLTQTWGCITTNKLHLPSPVLSFVALLETMSPTEDHSLVMDRFICTLAAPYLLHLPVFRVTCRLQFAGPRLGI